MNFLYPGFLFSLLAVAIPILIHLFNFRKFKTVYFSNVAFLKAVQEQNSSREKLRGLLVLLCRMLAVIFLVFAFAKPYFSAGSSAVPGQGRLINIYIDNSYSMEAQNRDGSLLEEAKRKAIAIVRQGGPNDRFQLTTNDFEGRHQRSASGTELISLIAEVSVSPASRTLQQVVNRQQAAAAGQRSLISYILSDFQASFSGHRPISAGEGNRIVLLRLQANTVPNVAVDSVWSLSPSHRPGDQEKFVVQLKNYGTQAAAAVPLKLVLNNQQKAMARVSIPAGMTRRDTLSFSGLSPGWQRATVSIKDYPLVFDDSLRFTFRVNSGLKILHLNGDPRERHIAALFSGDPYFQLSTMAEANIVYNSFADYQVMILSGLHSPSSGLAQQLKSYVKNGGTVVIFPNLDAAQPVYSSFLSDLSLPAVLSLSRDTVAVTKIDLRSSLFNDVFEEVPAKVDLPRINRHFVYGSAVRSSRQDILALPDGQLFFGRYTLGAGRIFLSATSLQEKDSNLPQHPLFVPLLYKIALTSVMDQPLSYTVGSDNLLSAAQLRLSPNESLRLVAGRQEVIPEIRQVPGKTLLYIADQVKQPAFYDLRKGEELLASYAFNASCAESDGQYSSDKQLQQLFGAKKISINGVQDKLSATAPENNHMELWKLCLVLCAVFLAVEVLLIRFFNKKHIQT